MEPTSCSQSTLFDMILIDAHGGVYLRDKLIGDVSVVQDPAAVDFFSAAYSAFNDCLYMTFKTNTGLPVAANFSLGGSGGNIVAIDPLATDCLDFFNNPEVREGLPMARYGQMVVAEGDTVYLVEPVVNPSSDVLNYHTADGSLLPKIQVEQFAGEVTALVALNNGGDALGLPTSDQANAIGVIVGNEDVRLAVEYPDGTWNPSQSLATSTAVTGRPGAFVGAAKAFEGGVFVFGSNGFIYKPDAAGGMPVWGLTRVGESIFAATWIESDQYVCYAAGPGRGSIQQYNSDWSVELITGGLLCTPKFLFCRDNLLL